MSGFPKAGKVILLKHWAVEDWVLLCLVTDWETSAGTRQMKNGGNAEAKWKKRNVVSYLKHQTTLSLRQETITERGFI